MSENRYTVPSSEREQREIASLVDKLIQVMTQRDKGTGLQRRDVHIKMHGAMRAEFTVNDGLPPELRVGLFAQPATYKAWVRFSNGSNDLNKPDISGDYRGMAIKLMGVPGQKMLESDPDGTTHDLITFSAQNFMVHTAADVKDLMGALTGGLLDKLFYAIGHPRVIWILLTNMRKYADVLQVRYFSAVPYAFGPFAVKYVATPRVDKPTPMPDDPAPDFLREGAQQHLRKQEAVFDFAIQFQRDEACMPVEDATRTWSLTLSPPRPVATLRILQQEFDTPEIREFGEQLSFSPWRCLPQHQPLGVISRARRVVYERISQYRHEQNHKPRVEPTGWDVPSAHQPSSTP